MRAGNILWGVDPSRHGWSSLGGNIAGNPCGLFDSIGNMQVFVRGADNTLQRQLLGAGWSGYGGSIAN